MCWRRRSQWRHAGVIFVHVPKAAGTSIAHALYGRSMGHMRASEIKRYCPDLFAKLPTFAVARNPWDRAVSSYHFVKQGGSSDAGVWRPDRYTASAFRSFDAFVDEWLPAQNLRTVDYVFQPQSWFVEDASQRLLVDYMGRMEDMVALERFLRDRLGRDVVVVRRNASARADGYRTSYTPHLRDRVAEIYRRDIELFGYDF